VSLEKLSETIYTWFRYSAKLGYDLNGHYLAGDEEGTLLVDPPEMSEDELDEIGSLGEPQLIVITNHSHWRATAAHLDRWPVQVLAHEVDAPRLAHVDRTLVGGERLPGGWQVVHVPGKTRGEIALYNPAYAGTLLVGDTLIGEPPGNVSLLPDAKLEDKNRLMESLHKIGALDFDTLLVGDGRSIFGGADRIVRAFVEGLAA
jgi:glyoxylase-like metal-dependent hydrolase (beta-lactamase superfamily II)